jgi:hypothetical protein
MAQAQRCALGFRAAMRSDQCPQPRAVDILDVVHIQDDLLLSFSDQPLQFLSQRIAFLAEHDAAVQRHHGHAVHFAVRHLQSHVCFLLIEK